MHAYSPVYRTILKNAARTAWRHRGLWPFAFLAGLAQTGAVTNDVLRMAPKLQPGTLSFATLEETWNGFAFGKTYVAALATGTPAQIIATLVLTLLTIAALAVLVVAAQHLVLHAVARPESKHHTTPARWRAMLRELTGIHSARIAATDVVFRLAIILALLGGGVLLRSILAAVPGVAVVAAFGMYMLLLPVIFALSSLSMVTLVEIVRGNATIIHAFHRATTFTARHWLATLEFAAVLFLLNFLFTAVLIVSIILFAEVLLAVFSSGITALGALVVLFGITALLLTAFIIFLGGMMTLFNYASWTQFVSTLTQKAHHPRLEHAAARVRRALRRTA